MNIIELTEKLGGEYGLDMSSDSADAWRQVFIHVPNEGRLKVADVTIDSDGDIIIEADL